RRPQSLPGRTVLRPGRPRPRLPIPDSPSCGTGRSGRGAAPPPSAPPPSSRRDRDWSWCRRRRRPGSGSPILLYSLAESGEPRSVLGSELDAQDGPPPLLQGLAVALGLGGDQGAEGVGGLGHGQILHGLVHDLEEAAAIRSSLVELPRGVEEAWTIALGDGEAGLAVQPGLEVSQGRGGLR